MLHNVHIVDCMDLPGGERMLAVRVENVSPEQLLFLNRNCPKAEGFPDAVAQCGDDPASVFVTLARSRLEALVREMMAGEPFRLLGEQLQQALDGEARSRQTERVLKCRDRELKLGQRTLIMGILNVTPDSFSDGGKYNTVEAAVRRAKQMVEEGADLIDVGGESTRPGSQSVPLDVELQRVIPVVEALLKEIDVPLSIDTYKAEVARQALAAGAHIINDQWRLKADPEMARVAAEFRCPVILMHNRHNKEYANLLSGIVADLRESIDIARRAGIEHEQIVLDPGIGFAKTYEDNLRTMSLLKPLTLLGYPLLLGTSRKSMIRLTLDLPPDDVVEGTAATVAYGIAQGCRIVRVHDVKAMKRVAAMTDAMVKLGR